MRSPFRRAPRPDDEARRSPTAIVAGITIPAVLAVLAIINPGVKIAEVELNDGAVWVTNSQGLKLGRYNAEVKELNAGLVAGDPAFDVLQDAQDVVLTEPGKVSVVDPASVTLAAQAEVPGGSQVAMAAGVLAITGQDGSVWVRGTSALTTIDAETPGDLDLADGAASAVTTDGTVLAFDPADGSVTGVDGEGAAPEVVATYDTAVGERADEVAAVGEVLVVRSGTTLHGPGWSTDLSEHGADVVLQHSSRGADVVLAATPTAFLEVDLDDGAVEVTEPGDTGVPAKPVRVGDCAYGAWAAPTANYVTRCGDGEPEVEDLESMTAAQTLVFRVNRTVVILNDTAQGRLWLPEDLPKAQEPNWQDVEEEQEPDDREEQSDDVQTAQQLLTQCTDQSVVPGAVDDVLGVRPGRTSVIQVLNNDTAGDCGIIAISEHDPIPETFGYLERIYGGRALQVVVLPDAQGTVEFTYTITDGRGQNPPSTATVQLSAIPADANSDPVQVRTAAVEVEQGATIEQEVLANFVDPDGDDLILVGATTDGTGTVRARRDGILTFVADGDELGRQVVQLSVSDGTATIVGELYVDVRSVGSLPPVIDPVHAETYVGTEVDVDVLASVRTASREPARLASVEELAGTTIVPSLDDGSFTFTAPTPGTYYVTFTVVASPQQASGVARIDVKEWPAQPLPPVAVRDVALLPAGGEVTVAPLRNDVDPNGGVLVLTSATAAPESALQIAIVEHRFVRISALRTLDAPETITYVISNGVAEARGEILVQPVPPSAEQHAPVVQDIEVTVRTGGVVTIPALDYAYDADGDDLELVPELAEPLASGQGLLFVSGNELRYQAPSSPTTATATFSVRDTAKNEGSARLVVTVHESSPDTKAPPRPKDLTARTFAGEVVRVTVPLTGIDRDGDGVILLGQGDTAPTKGRIVAVGASWIEYEAFPGESGTDTFTYAVEDWVGQRAVATVRVGIAPRPTDPLPIVARHDEVTVQPGQLVEVRVLRNDVDPSGGELFLEPTIEVPPGIDARVEGRRIVVQAPDEPTDPIVIPYAVSNERGGRASAVLTVYVVEDAVILPPVASDITVAPLEVVGKTSVEVDVFQVAENPSGPLSDLEVSIPSSHTGVAQVTAAGRVLVTLGSEARTVPYLLSNTLPAADGVSSYAFITVPAVGDFPPVLRPKARALRVASGAELEIPIAEFVQVGTGKTARITDSARVSATRSDGTELVVDETTLRFVSAAGYAGPASVTFEVTDGTSRTDPAGRRATLTLPITVYTEDDYPPTFSPGTIEVPQGDAAKTIDLLAFTEGPEGADGSQSYTFLSAGTPTPGFVVNLDGTTLSVSAAADVPRGTQGSADLTLGYGRSGTLPVRVTFQVVASSRNLTRVSSYTLDGAAGQETRVNVIGDVQLNPFPGEPLTLQGATVETPGSGTASVSGGTVVVRPADGFVGDMVVRYRVRDVTNDPLREVEGRIQVKVRDRPDAPAAPRVGDVTSQTIVLSWDAPDNNGAPITGYRLTRSPGGQTTTCASTTCTVTGLTNGTEYTFTVAAQNAVGWSAESSTSSRAVPDAVPDVPGPPVLADGDGEVTVTWSAPANSGTPVTQYTIELSDGSTRSTGGTSVTFTGLTNGTAYEARVRAHNRATPPEGGTWSAWSEAKVPAGLPGAPAVSASRVATQLGGQINITWTAPSTNGDPIRSYSVSITGDGAPAPFTVGGDVTGWNFANAVNGVEYTISVAATNKRGTGPAGTTTTSTFAEPTAPRTPSIQAGVGHDHSNGQVTLSWSAPESTGGRGVLVQEYVILAGGTEIARTAGTSFTHTGRPGGVQTATYSVRACNTRGACGPTTTIGSVTPVTLPAAPTVSVVPTPGQFDRVNASWSDLSAGTANGGSALVRYEYRLSTGGGWRDTTSTSLTEIDVPGGVDSVSVEVRAVTGAGAGRAGTGAGSPDRTAAPSAPAPVGTSVAPLELTITWTPPAANGSTITGYMYDIYRVNPTTGADEGQVAYSQWSSTSPVTWKVPGPGSYVAEVRALSNKGDSAVGTSTPVAVGGS
ncbi:Ig-like domain-containing protein [Sanguibacter suaedae]|uniref:Fibronectin type III domain-containing protein n=1 Tax=Sanguibacter suaedae TaxID=2795737 RepID=A0A934I822_9MICO|nr:fibronectin type III domain-containing protein [Sanguibacter suaedae]MBI9115951.1 fibronectin type III domain-containing protein [Sanguibacter suaedae]